MTPDWYEDLAERLGEAADEAGDADDGISAVCFGWARQAAKRRADDLRHEPEHASAALAVRRR